MYLVQEKVIIPIANYLYKIYIQEIKNYIHQLTHYI